MKITDKVKKITARANGIDIRDVMAESRFVDLDDSVGNLEVVMMCEEEFEIEISDGQAEQCETVGELIGLVETIVKENATPSSKYEL
jgi:acyl carrier protein